MKKVTLDTDAELQTHIVFAGHVRQHDFINAVVVIETRQVIAVWLQVPCRFADQRDVTEEELEITYLEATRATRVDVSYLVEHECLVADCRVQAQKE